MNSSLIILHLKSSKKQKYDNLIKITDSNRIKIKFIYLILIIKK